jgi:hypothetical protein
MVRSTSRSNSSNTTTLKGTPFGVPFCCFCISVDIAWNYFFVREEFYIPNFGTYIPNFGMCIPNFGIYVSGFAMKIKKLMLLI